MLQFVPGTGVTVPNLIFDLQDLDVRTYHKANGMFQSLRRKAELAQFWRSLSRRDGKLLDLASVNDSCRISGQHALGSQSVSLKKIVGSASRSQDYDAEFRPLRHHLHQRWVKIAALRLMNVSLPAVELIQIGDAYFVVDGHHRISVARALGQDYIDAQVTVWHLEVRLSPEMVNAGMVAPHCFPSSLSLARGG